jgi:hypothetical protein
MEKIASRRFLLRDDGTGRGRDSEVLISEFLSYDSLVILGDPGIGKTTLLKQLAGDQYLKVRSFLVNPQAPVSGVLFLDALDEYRNTAGSQDAILDVARAISALRKPHFRLSCRAADWFGSVDKEVLSSASASGRIVVLELLPLNEQEIELLVSEFVPDPKGFLTEARSAGLGGLLGNPQTLELIASAWRAPKRPRNKFEAYQLGIAELLKETNEAHVKRSSQPNLVELRAAASAAASVLLLSNSEFLSRLESRAGEGTALLSEIPTENSNAIEQSLRRRVFRSTKEDRFEFVHRTIEEFLAGEDLAARIANGLPISRAFSLMCGDDGVPISSLRGLYAWLICHLASRSAAYVARDPYAVVTYGDASVLPPESQRALWSSLRSAGDPWFLSGGEGGASFRKLANKDTAKELGEILADPSASSHLQVAALEAIAVAERDLELTTAVRAVVVKKDDNIWLRTTALRAFDNLVKSDSSALRELDEELSKDPSDGADANVRLELLLLRIDDPNVSERTLSVLRHLVSSEGRRSAVGRLYELAEEYPESAIDDVLRSASSLFNSEHDESYEVKAFVERILVRRLESVDLIDLKAVAPALLAIRRNGQREESALTKGLGLRLAREPSLLHPLFDALAEEDAAHSLWVFASYHLWEVMPGSIWPVSPSSFMLERAEREAVTERAADFFRLYVAWFPRSDGDALLAEAGFSFLDRRPDVAGALGDWHFCEIDEWRLAQYRRRTENAERKVEVRRTNVEHFMPRLNEVASGAAQHELRWAAQVFFGAIAGVTGATPTERFKELANSQIEAACIKGFINYVEREDIPSAREVIECWAKNQIPWRHTLLSLSVYYRTTSELTIPAHAEAACIAEVITGLNGDGVPGFRPQLYKWVKAMAQAKPEILKPILETLWLSNRGSLYGFHELSQEPTLSQFLADVSATVLRSPRCDNHTISVLVPIVFSFAPARAEQIAQERLFDPCIEGPQRVIWIVALYLNNPKDHDKLWRQLDSESNDVFWEAIEFIGGRHGGVSREMDPALRVEIIATAGKRFPPADFPTGVSTGARNAWDASTFVSRQIDLLAAQPGPRTIDHLYSLERDSHLSGYVNYIRHRLSEAIRQKRERSFTAPLAAEVRRSLSNAAPGSVAELIAYIEEHLLVLSYELTRTQKELYRAYWNEKGRDLLAPKREEVCSGFLAEDLQNRVRDHGLVVTVEHHMVRDKECDVVVLQGSRRLLPLEVKHHYHTDLWTAWERQLQRLYASDAAAQGYGIYLVLWSGEASGKKVPKAPNNLPLPNSPVELQKVITSLIPIADRYKLRVVIVDISPPGKAKAVVEGVVQ